MSDDLQPILDAMESRLGAIELMVSQLMTKLVIEPEERQRNALAAMNAEMALANAIERVMQEADKRFPGLRQSISFIEAPVAKAALCTQDPLAVFEYLYRGPGKKLLVRMRSMKDEDVKKEVAAVYTRISTIKSLTKAAMDEVAKMGVMRAQKRAQKQDPEN